MRVKFVISACIFFVPLGCLVSDNSAPGFLEGRLRILAFKEVELAESSGSKFSTGNYAEYPLIILSQDGKREIARVMADGSGNYRVALPPGDYILDAQARMPKGHVRAKPQRFTVTSNRVAHVDMLIDAGVR
jgi:hypothetical protein